MYPFLRKILDKYAVIAAVHVHTRADGTRNFNLIILEQKRHELRISKKASISDIQEISKEIPPNTPLCVVISGKGVLQKSIPSEIRTASKGLNSVLPNASVDEFIVQIMEGFENNWIALVRKDFAEQLIGELQKQKLSIISLDIGVMSIHHIIPILKDKTSVLDIGINELVLLDNKVVAIQAPSSEEISTLDIGGEKIESIYALGFSSAFKTILHLEGEGVGVDEVTQLKEEYLYNKLFRKAGITGLITIFFLLLLNFVLFSYYNNKNAELNSKLGYRQSQLIELQSLKDQLKQKQEFFDQNSVVGSSKLSYYADRLAASLPSGIKLKGLNIFPTTSTKKNDEDKYFRFDTKAIFIKGESNRSNTLNKWIRELEELEWINTVEVLPYSESNKGLGEFELKIIISQ
ncbi:MAG: hypothetical protein DWQ02_01045 [Bacteroidetes bacterium]|nr:MAG: hypothetical protein DWQ02_01045 [Bacteroidota bacterium]